MCIAVHRLARRLVGGRGCQTVDGNAVVRACPTSRNSDIPDVPFVSDDSQPPVAMAQDQGQADNGCSKPGSLAGDPFCGLAAGDEHIREWEWCVHSLRTNSKLCSGQTYIHAG